MSLARERVGMGLMVAGTAVLLARHAVAALFERRSASQRRRRELSERHVVLPASATVGRRTIIVGDIHGCPGPWRGGRGCQGQAGAAGTGDEPRSTLSLARSLAPFLRAPSPMHTDELRALLLKLGYSRGRDLLLSVGDLVNKGPDSEQARCWSI